MLVRPHVQYWKFGPEHSVLLETITPIGQLCQFSYERIGESSTPVRAKGHVHDIRQWLGHKLVDAFMIPPSRVVIIMTSPSISACKICVRFYDPRKWTYIRIDEEMNLSTIMSQVEGHTGIWNFGVEDVGLLALTRMGCSDISCIHTWEVWSYACMPHFPTILQPK
ncbi:hypothetical protein VNO77_02931 [Canavalia gladiata]|uniref:Uncharacterized protein n=1 Tax=Canavalia gladiata TaxID=3824 RepID=A0AAN9MYU6_CANGL